MEDREFDGSDFKVLQEYIRYLRENTRAAPMIRPFKFYAFDYDFDKETRPYETIRFWDMMPLVFVFDAYKHKNGINFVGINFHHMPVISRQIWLARIKKLQKEKFPNNRLLRMSYHMLWKMFIKATKFATRQYRVERVSRLREVDNNQMDDLMRFYANTYYGATYQNIVSNYKKYRPSKPK
jgi:hypothetical protein